MAVGLTCSYLTVLAMGQALSLLISGNLPINRHGFPLRIGSHRCPRISGTLDLPSALRVAHSMLIFTHRLTSKQR